ncbi:hypothetical protein HMPREF2534_03116 [Bacteroides thetaiotaomicron]|nr:hypothetical protein HMPREF2534_03116 [Bacteroides thetaiotaomicron]
MLACQTDNFYLKIENNYEQSLKPPIFFISSTSFIQVMYFFCLFLLHHLPE